MRCCASLALSLLLATLLGCSGQRAPEPGVSTASPTTAPERSAEPVVDVTTARVRRGSILERVTAPGSLRARRESRIGAEVSGRIQQVFVNDGDRVEAGAPLFQIDRGPFEMALRQAVAVLDVAHAERAQIEADLTRGNALRRSDIVAAEQLERMRTQVAVAKAHERQASEGVALARHHLEQTLVAAPFGGSVAQRLVDEGTTALAQPQTIVIVLQETDVLEAEANIPESQLSVVQVGDTALVHVEGLPQPIQTEVSAVSDTIDPTARTYRVQMLVPNSEHALKAGVFARIDIEPKEKRDVVLVPRAAVRSEDGETRVLVVRDGRALAVPVQLGVVSESDAEVLAGLDLESDVIVGAEAREVAPGMSVRIVAAPPEPRVMKLADTSIRRPVFAVMLIGALVVLGAVSIPRLGIDLWPRIEFPMVVVSSVLEGAAPDTMEREVSQVLEESINTIEGISSLRSISSDSLSIIYVEFELEYDIQEKAQEVRDKVAAVSGELPRDVETPVVERVDPDAQPILVVMLAGPQSIRTISEFADKRLKPRLERIPGVGSVTLAGGRKREIRIWIDPLRLGGYGLAVDDVLGALQREHVEMPGGRLETESHEWALRTEGKLTSAEQFGAVVVSERAGSVIHLRDVANVEDGMAEERTISQLNGRRGVALQVRRQSGENTVAVADAVKRELESVRADLPPGYEMLVARDASRFIRSSIYDVFGALLIGAVLASIVVFLFLRDLRSTLITAVAIPTSIMATFIFFYFFGFTLNTMTLMALSLSIGLLIDDAIVVLENTFRHMELGAPPKQAASTGTGEIGLAVIATSLAIGAVFVPIAFMSGVVGRFFREFGIVATCAVFMSALVALTLVPMLCSRYLRPTHKEGWIYRVLESLYVRLETQYRRTLAWGLRHRPATLALAIAAVVGGVAMVRAVPVTFVIPEDRGEFNVWLKLPLGSSVHTTQKLTADVVNELRRSPEVAAVFSTIGAGATKRVNEAELFVQLVHKSQRDVSQQRFMADLRGRIGALGLPLQDYAVEEIGFFSVAGSRNAQLMYAIRGPDGDRLQYFARGIVERMRAAGGYADMAVSYETGKPEIALEITRERAADLGVPALQIGRTISALFAGYKAATFEEGGERYDVRVQVLPEYRDDPAKLALVSVRAPSGALVPLRNLVNPRAGSGPVQIERESRTRSITVRGNLDGKAAGQADVEITRFARDLGIGGEYEFAAVGPTERLRESLSAILFAFVLALVAIYMILAAQFNSFVHPFTIMLSAPLSFIGSFAAIALMGMQLDTLGQIAFLMLMGIVMKNGILLVDYTNTVRRRGVSAREAVLEAGPVRLRPVLMTAVSTIFGMLPLAYGTGDGSEWRQPMGIVSIGGLVASTLLTLLIVPIAYTLFDDVQNALKRGLGSVFGAGLKQLGRDRA